jgi:methyl-accepting chemotaxis protein
MEKQMRFPLSFGRTAVPFTMSLAASGIVAWAGDLAVGPVNPVILAMLAAAAGTITLQFAGRVRDAGTRAFMGKNGEEIEHFMIGAAETSHFIDTIKKRIEEDVDMADSIVANAEQNATTLRQIAANAQRASRAAADVRNESTAGGVEIDRGLRLIHDAQSDAEAACAKMTDLQKKSRSIQAITDLINEIATGTNLLALNAAIEAAHAGVHGRGFAVVAGEVKKLAQRTTNATGDIARMVNEICREAEEAAVGMTALSGKVTDAAQTVERVHVFLSKIEQVACTSEQEAQQIAAASHEQVESTAEINMAISQIRDNMRSTDAQLPQATHSAMMLAERAESLFEALAGADVKTQHDAVREAAEAAARDVERIFADAIARGQISEADLFDRNYLPIRGTNPQKFTTRFDAFTDRVLPPVQEKLLADMPQLAYAGAVDNNGYFPTHNTKFSQPLTGNYDADLVNNRTKRIFDDRTGSRCGSHTKTFLMQTYKRDTGEVMHDLSVPIRVAGKHWGGFRVGYRSGASPATAPSQPAPARAPATATAALQTPAIRPALRIVA